MSTSTTTSEPTDASPDAAPADPSGRAGRRTRGEKREARGRLSSVWPALARIPREHPFAMAIVVAASVAGGFLEALMLLLLVQAASALSTGEDAIELGLGPLQAGEVSVTAILSSILVVAAIRFGFQLVTVTINSRVFRRRMIRNRTRLIDAFLRSRWEVQSAEREGHFSDLAWTQSARSAQLAEQVSMTYTAMINVATLLLSTLAVDPLAAIVTAVVLGGFGAMVRPVMGRSRSSSASATTAGRTYAAWLIDLIRMSKDVTVFGVVDEVSRHNRKAVRPAALHASQNRFYAQLMPAVYQTGAVLILALAILVIRLLDLGSLAELGAIILLLYRSLAYGQSLQSLLQTVNDTLPGIELLDTELARLEANPAVEGGRPLGGIDSIELRDVELVYADGRAGVHGIDLEVRRGECVGIVGPSGAGKSTLIQILLRLREPTSGQMLVNGEPASEQSLKDWRRQVSWLPQDPELLVGTVADNVRFFREASPEAIERALAAAHVADDVAGWDDGLDQEIGGRGNAVSGGQRQRLALARALVDQPDVLVLDEPTSALDARSEQEVTRTLEELRGEVTMFVVSHRMSTLRMCDRIVVLRDGTIEMVDTPEHLERQDGFMREALEISGALTPEIESPADRSSDGGSPDPDPAP